MRLFTLILASLTWAGVSALVDHWSRNFGLSFGLGAVAALVVVMALSMCHVSAMAERDREE